MLFDFTPNEPVGVEDAPIATQPIAYLTEVILATSGDWECLPGLAPLFLREAMEDLLVALQVET